jgi:nitric oxide reductase subunit C
MPGTRLFFLAALLVSGVIVVALAASVLTPRDVPPEVTVGYNVWRANSCEGCHTLFGQGGSYAPDLTNIYEQRGETYLREFLVNPNAFHPNQRLMPRFGLTILETDSLLAFLEWAGQQETGWPPRTIRVSGDGAVLEVASAASDGDQNALPDDPVARGRNWFKSPPANCATCHALEPDVVIVGPSLAGIATRAGMRVRGQTSAEYIRNSMMNPGEYIVEGFQNVMVQNLADMLSSDQINDITAYLMTLE